MALNPDAPGAGARVTGRVPYLLFHYFCVARKSSRLLLPVVVAASLAACSNATVAAPPPPVTSGSIFDDFLGSAGSVPSPQYWDYEWGGVGWGNGELQSYTASTDNIRLDGDGHLVIQALETGRDSYTSGRLVTRGNLNMRYGTVTARIKFPSGQGIWPAFWMLGTAYHGGRGTVGWPDCGEIDIMELVNVADYYHVGLHASDGSGGDVRADGYVGKEGSSVDLSQDFHDYWVIRSPNRIQIGVDGTTLGDFTPADMPDGADLRVFSDQPMYALLNIAVGGAWPGPPNASTKFPAAMLVDWFRFDPATS
jgi:beta-glucanase (GH16 family)